MNIILKISFIIFGILLVNSYCQTLTNAQIKEDQLRNMAKQDGIIVFNSTGFDYYAMEKDRKYDIVIFFSANSCDFCNKIEDEYKRVQQLYYENNALYPVLDKEQNLNAIFFGKMTYDYSTKITYEQLNFTTVPFLVLFKPDATKSMNRADPYLKKFIWGISGTDGHVNAQKILTFLNRRSFREIQYQEKISSIITLLLCAISLLVVGGFIVFKFHSFIFNQITKNVVSMIIYCICMSGVVYNSIHNVPFTTSDKAGNIVWFSEKDPRGQLGLEGLLISIMISLSGIFLLFVALMNQNVESVWTRRILSYILLFLAYTFIKYIEALYLKKGWYQIAFWPPSNYQKGSFSVDQGITI